MSSDQWDPAQVVRVRLSVDCDHHLDQVGDRGHARWSAPMPRWQAEQWLASSEWLACPLWEGKRVMSAAIVTWTHD